VVTVNSAGFSAPRPGAARSGGASCEQAAPPEPAPRPLVPKTAPVSPKLEPVKPKVQVPVPEPVETPEPAPVKPVSLQPVKKKVQKVDQEKLAEEQAKRQREQDRQKDLARARAEEERARIEAERARATLAEMIRQRGAQQSSSAARGPSGRQEVQSIVLQQYLSALYDRIHQFWVLPDMRQWSSGLETVVVLTILPDGTVAGTMVEKKSSDPFFDQFVMKTIQNASPLPRFPKLLKESSLEVGLRFRPGEVMTM
jgi:colicin import membrane protein